MSSFNARNNGSLAAIVIGDNDNLVKFLLNKNYAVYTNLTKYEVIEIYNHGKTLLKIYNGDSLDPYTVWRNIQHKDLDIKLNNG
jgi:hypothetical protein